LTTTVDPIGGKVNELDWFAFETRVRKIIQELIEPTMKRVIEDRDSITGMKKAFDSH